MVKHRSSFFVLSDEEAVSAGEVLRRVAARLAGMTLASTRDLGTRQLATHRGTLSTAELLRSRFRERPSAAKQHMTVATAVGGPLAATGDALNTGAISYDHAATMVAVMGRLHPDVPHERRDEAHRFLLTWALQLDPQELAGPAGIYRPRSTPTTTPPAGRKEPCRCGNATTA